MDTPCFLNSLRGIGGDPLDPRGELRPKYHDRDLDSPHSDLATATLVQVMHVPSLPDVVPLTPLLS